MPFIPIDLPPGVFRNGTRYQAKGRWFDSLLVRWTEQAMQAVGGWQRVKTTGLANLLLSSENLSSVDWSDVGTPTVVANVADGPDGAPNMGDSIEDNDAAAAEGRSQAVTVADNLVQYTVSVFVKKGSVSDPNCALELALSGGTGLSGPVVLNPVDGATAVGVSLDAGGAEDYDTYWRLWGQITNNGTGNVTLTVTLTPAFQANGTPTTTTAVAATGTNTFFGAQASASVQVLPYVATTTAAVGATDSKDVDLVGPAMGAFAWRDNGGDAWLGLGTHAGVFVFSEGGLTDITPAGFVAGKITAATTQNYGDGPYGVGVYGEGDPSQATITEAQSWQFDNFGQVLVAVAHSDGVLYSWDLTLTNNLAEVDASAPTSNIGCVVTPERFLVALGSNGDPREVTWADQESLTTWTPTSGNQAGDFILPSIGGILAGLRGRQETLIWTTDELFAMRYIGGALVYQFTQVGKACGAISRRAMAMVDGGRAFWMGHRSFFGYAGEARPIPSDVSDYVFSDINRLQASKIHAVARAEFQEIRWYYCSAGSEEIDRSVAFNYAEGHWSIDPAPARTAGVDRGVFSFPMEADRNGVLYDHERGNSYTALDGVTALTPFAESGPFEIGHGDRTLTVLQIIPDETTLGDVSAKLFTRAYPTAAETEFGPFTLANPTPVRLSGRQARLRVTQVNPGWRVGHPRLEIVAGERR